MLLIWGSRETRRKLGFVAERCPRCSTVRTVRIDRIGLTSHVFFVSFTAGPLIGFRGECQTCSGTFEVCPLDYAAFDKNKKATPESLIATTNPALLEQSKSARTDRDRALQIRAPLLRFEVSLRDRYLRGRRLDLITGLAFTGSIAIPIAIGWAARSLGLTEELQTAVGWTALAVFLLGIVFSLVLLHGEPKRFFNRKLRPEIVTALRVLHLEKTELESCVSSLRKYGYRISRFISADSLVEECRGIVVR